MADTASLRRAQTGEHLEASDCIFSVINLRAAAPCAAFCWSTCFVGQQIIEDTASLRLAQTGEPLEVSLTRDLKHTGIMSTLGYTYSDASAVPVTTAARSATAAAAAGAGVVRPQRPGGAAGVWGRGNRAAVRPGSRVCWMLFEYCDKGVLGVSSTAGSFVLWAASFFFECSGSCR
jgi:hypothetical protein